MFILILLHKPSQSQFFAEASTLQKIIVTDHFRFFFIDRMEESEYLTFSSKRETT